MSRYIDAEILLDAMRHITLGETDVARSEMKIVHYICHMPHIDDVRENVRGYWKKRKDKPLQNWYQCSSCGAICGETPKYCSECGADMRGGDAK